MSHPLNTPIGRFGIETHEGTGTRVVATIPVAGLVNPLTGAPTVAPLAMLLDHVGGLANHIRKGDDEWTLTTELSLELVPEAVDLIAGHGDPVVAHARPFAHKTRTALALAEFTHRGTVIGTGTVRSFYIVAAEFTDFPSDPAHHERKTGLADMMAVRPGPGPAELRQAADPVLNNSLGVVHGGVAATGLELVADAAVNAAGAAGDPPLRTGSLRVNYLRRLLAGDQSRYEATALRVGRSTGTASAQAVGADGRQALTAHYTAYR
ncbi:PaaI family thioesterase [Mycolicibacterium arseniciresistens]|uniref:PaaI family thioesterase n=1 Tax=Mycolicibacterium arseniciresistens TaxID=3062257 RepID=A0ABT8UDI5_9MYCO|nr:PaaI family thioesterase [Mycolicibacterium arseniciresistens]MDO3635854.1 PaaI family thioesterase [Mycolicibacterium arseniciresistens]